MQKKLTEGLNVEKLKSKYKGKEDKQVNLKDIESFN